MRELLGMPQRVLYAAQRQKGIYLSAAFDYGSYVCHFETGVDIIARFDAYLEAYSNDKIVRVDYDTPYVRNLPIRLTIWEAKQTSATQHIENPAWGDSFVIEWEALYDNILGNCIPKTSPEDFRQDLELFKQGTRKVRRKC
jgi:predicted dehydrogenase